MKRAALTFAAVFTVLGAAYVFGLVMASRVADASGWRFEL